MRSNKELIKENFNCEGSRLTTGIVDVLIKLLNSEQSEFISRESYKGFDRDGSYVHTIETIVKKVVEAGEICLTGKSKNRFDGSYGWDDDTNLKNATDIANLFREHKFIPKN